MQYPVQPPILLSESLKGRLNHHWERHGQCTLRKNTENSDIFTGICVYVKCHGTYLEGPKDSRYGGQAISVILGLYPRISQPPQKYRRFDSVAQNRPWIAIGYRRLPLHVLEEESSSWGALRWMERGLETGKCLQRGLEWDNQKVMGRKEEEKKKRREGGKGVFIPEEGGVIWRVDDPNRKSITVVDSKMDGLILRSNCSDLVDPDPTW